MIQSVFTELLSETRHCKLGIRSALVHACRELAVSWRHSTANSFVLFGVWWWGTFLALDFSSERTQPLPWAYILVMRDGHRAKHQVGLISKPQWEAARQSDCPERPPSVWKSLLLCAPCTRSQMRACCWGEKENLGGPALNSLTVSSLAWVGDLGA